MPACEQFISWSITIGTRDGGMEIVLVRTTQSQYADKNGTLISGKSDEVTGEVVIGGDAVPGPDRWDRSTNIGEIAASLRHAMVSGNVKSTGTEVEKIRKWILSYYPPDLVELLKVYREYTEYTFDSIERDYRVSYTEETK